MPNPKYFSGTDTERVAFGNQIKHLAGVPSLAIIGPLGRAIIYQAFNYKHPNVQPVALRVGNSSGSSLKGIDIIDYVDTGGNWLSDPHDLNPEYGDHIFAIPNEWHKPVRLWNEISQLPNTLEIDEEVLKLSPRQLETYMAQTFKVGTHLLVERLLVANHMSSERMVGFEPETKADILQRQAEDIVGLEEFSRFAASIRDSHPQEFNTVQQEAPFEYVISGLVSYHASQ